MILRKIRSSIKLLLKKINSTFSKFKILILEENIILGKKVFLNKNIKMKTFDNGKIIIKENVSIEDNVEIIAQNAIITIEANTFIGCGTQIIAKKSISIGKDCLIASYSVLRDNNHNINKNEIIRKQGHSISPIIVENDVWVGTHCTITAGTNIHKGAVIGANSVVTKDIEEYTVVGGVPANFIKKRV